MSIIVGVPEQEIEERAQQIRAAHAAWRPKDKDRRQMFDDQSGLCPICSPFYGPAIGALQGHDGVTSAVDHAIAVMTYACMNIPIEDAIRFANDKRNLVLVHPSCNGAKNSRDLDYLLELIEDGKFSLTETKMLTAEEIEARRVQVRKQRRGRGPTRKMVESTPKIEPPMDRELFSKVMSYLGKLGGSSNGAAKAAAARRNGMKGGRPKGSVKKQFCETLAGQPVQ